MKKIILFLLIFNVLNCLLICDDLVPGSSFNAKMRWLNSNARRGGKYIVEVDSDQNINPIEISYEDKEYITIIIRGKGNGTNKISTTIEDWLFTVRDNNTLIFEDNLNIKGNIKVISGGNLIMNPGVRGPRIAVERGGSFTMNGGEISGWSGNGVEVSGVFVMNGGKIAKNWHGVYLREYGVFTMNGGEITGNSQPRNGSGGGVYAGGNFIMHNGKIHGNRGNAGAGVYLAGTMNMDGGTISSNYATTGGGVYVLGTLSMSGGTISNNNASTGGGVYVNSTFTMTAGEISGNRASSIAGGVYLNDTAVFNKTGGVITGYSDNNNSSNAVINKSGMVKKGFGHTIYASNKNNDHMRIKEATSDRSDNLLFNGNTTPPNYRGNWEWDF